MPASPFLCGINVALDLGIAPSRRTGRLRVIAVAIEAWIAVTLCIARHRDRDS